ncbi:COX assembly mitochondrial protein homolog isoform X1 [Octopus bimaculoides]|uniref:COX assembly mitochondrial protein homolog isoform X1 n=1 Tax=Octopus bimaculoides TaxID=37653 RepID=UPI0022E7D0BD|nr:COX assembly mitochondrial protein homolog isoform X1 [Octopus bimaculoides]
MCVSFVSSLLWKYTWSWGNTILLGNRRGLVTGRTPGCFSVSSDPDDLTLRKVEKEILIPQKMKEIAKREHCSTEVQSFGECAKQAGLLLTFQCRDKANLLHTCLSNMYKKEEFVERCTQEYLKDRTEYRRTGKKKLIKRV